MSKVVLVCGGRDFCDRGLLTRVLAENVWFGDVLVHGGARGADELAGEWARKFGIASAVFPANWEGEGKSAGYRRNARMLDHMRPDLVIAFPGGKGTEMMCQLASNRGVPIVRVT